MTTAHTDPLQPPPPAGQTSGADEAHFAATRGEFLLWTGVLGPAVVWSVQMLVVYALGPFSHAHRWLMGVHHAVSVIGIVGGLACGWVAWREWRRIGGGEPRGSEPDVPGRSRFLAALGILSSLFFTVVIIAQWLPTFFLDPGWY